MSKLVCILTVTMLAALTAMPAASQTAIPDLRGTWKGESESLVLGGGNRIILRPNPTSRSCEACHLPSPSISRTAAASPARFRRRKVIAVISRNGTIFLADDEGYTTGALLAPNRLELCYLHVSSASRIASCAELTKQQ